MKKNSNQKVNVIVEKNNNSQVVILDIDNCTMQGINGSTFSKNMKNYNILNSKKGILGGINIEFNKLDNGGTNPAFNKITMNKQIIAAHVDTINKNKELYGEGLDILKDKNTQIKYDDVNKQLIIDFTLFNIYADIKSTQRNYHEALYQLLHAYNDVLPDINNVQKGYNLYREKINQNDNATSDMTYPMFKTMIPYEVEKAQDYLLNQKLYVGGRGQEAVDRRKEIEAERKQLGEKYIRQQMSKLMKASKKSDKIEKKEEAINKTLDKIKTFINSNNNKNNIAMGLSEGKYIIHDGCTNWFEASVHHRIAIDVSNTIQSNTLIRELVTIDRLLQTL